MEELFQQQYDAHVKTHQRYLLLKLLDGAKSEAMEQFLAQKTPLPKERVVVPHPETALPPLAFEAAVDPNDFRIFTPRDIPAPAAAAVPALTPDMALFEGIAPCTVQPSAVTLATEAVIDPEIFSGIPNGTAVLPQPAAAYEPDVPVMDAGELLPSVSIPNAAFSYQPTIDDAAVAVSIPALEAAPVALPKVAPDASAFQNVALPQVTLPTVAIPPVSVSPVLSDSDLPQVTLPESLGAFTPTVPAADFTLPTPPADALPESLGAFTTTVPAADITLPTPSLDAPQLTAPPVAAVSVALPHIEPAAVSALKTSVAPMAFDDLVPSAAIQLPTPTRLTDVLPAPQQTAVSIPSVSVSATELPAPQVALPSVEIPMPAVSPVALPDLHFEPLTAPTPTVSLPSMQEVLDALGREQAQMTVLS